MARLTRTQKYADYRDKIAQDREESLQTERLSSYEDKLRQLESNFNNEPDTNLNQRVEPTRVVEAKPATNFEEVKRVQEESIKSLDDVLEEMLNASTPEVKPVQAEPQVKPVPQAQPTVQPQPVQPAPQPQPVQSAPQSQPQPVDLMSTMDIISTEVDELANIISEQPVPDRANIVAPEVELIKEKTVNDSFINKTFEEVNEFNRNEGRATVESISNSIVDEIRHPQTPSMPEIEVTSPFDSDFSNTVTLEIEKVLQEINSVKPQDNQTAELEVEQAFEGAKVNKETFEHPVLAKTQEEPVVEIKNINETFTNSFKDANVLDDTIPFNVDNQDIDDEDEYEDEEDTPSKALNVILGILIFVLVAVLGVIIYYILVAKGIIG